MPHLSWNELRKLRHIISDCWTIIFRESIQLSGSSPERAKRLKEDALDLKSATDRFDKMILKHEEEKI